MGLDNGLRVHSKRRTLTRDMLPSQLQYPWEEKFDNDGIEILYWRKNWGLRDEVIHTFPHYENQQNEYVLETANEVFVLINIIASFLNEQKWNEESESIWTYDEIFPILKRDIINLAFIATFMENNPDVYLTFYDSY